MYDEEETNIPGADGITLADFEAATAPITPDDIDFIGNEPRVVRTNDDDYGYEQNGKAPSRLRAGYSPPTGKITERPVKGAGIPTPDEWLDFFSRIVIRTATDFAIEMAFRGIDEELLTEREVESIKLESDERDRIARPLAEFAYKNGYTRKHGREIIAAAGSIDAVLQLGLWYTRMSRIAIKYRRMTGGETAQWQYRRPPRRKTRQPRERTVRLPVQTVITQSEEGEVTFNERTGPSAQSTTANGHDRMWRPSVGGPVVNPGG